MIDGAAACAPPGAGIDPGSELRRQAVLVEDLARRIEDIVRALPRHDALAGWWGPARDALQGAIDLERARLGREVGRLEGVRIQLSAAADQASIGSSSTAAPSGAP